MKKVGFVGVFDKTDLILCISRILVKAQQKVLFIDATSIQKSKYIVPTITPTISYITEFQEIDIAVGFKNINQVKQYMGLEEEKTLNYDYVFVDVDDYNGFANFELYNSDLLYYATSFDAYSLKKGISILHNLNTPVRMLKMYFAKEMYREEEEYFEYLSLGVKVEWEESKLYFLLENGDQAALIENQRLEEIKLKNLSNVYRDNVIYLVNEITDSSMTKNIKSIIKDL